MLVRAAASEWQADVGREVTIQIRPNPGGDIELDVAKAAAIARRSAGVVEGAAVFEGGNVAPARAVAGDRAATRRSSGAAADRCPDRVRRGARPGATAPDADRADPGCQPR
jgi:hypothetical protein